MDAGVGWAAVDVRIPDGGLDGASGSVPTPRGVVRIQWKLVSDGKFTVQLRVPVNVVAVVYFPGVPDAKGVTVGSGTHTIKS